MEVKKVEVPEFKFAANPRCEVDWQEVEKMSLESKVDFLCQIFEKLTVIVDKIILSGFPERYQSFFKQQE